MSGAFDTMSGLGSRMIASSQTGQPQPPQTSGGKGGVTTPEQPMVYQQPVNFYQSAMPTAIGFNNQGALVDPSLLAQQAILSRQPTAAYQPLITPESYQNFYTGDTFGGEGDSADSAGGGGGAGDGGCVIATHAVANGSFSKADKMRAVKWCTANLHDRWWGEAFRRGYRYHGNKAINAGTASQHYDEFKDFVRFATGQKRTFSTAKTFVWRSVQFFVTGLFLKGH